ncbi:hypothetical protein pb186bvf_017844 [Paramecium bursaria]
MSWMTNYQIKIYLYFILRKYQFRKGCFCILICKNIDDQKEFKEINRIYKNIQIICL